MDDRVRKLINEQIANEFHAAYLYLGMAAHFEHRNFDGFGKWMRAQAQEETGHAMRLFDYMSGRGESIELKAIEGPPTEFGSPLEVYRAALAHEQKVTGQIHAIYEAAKTANDYPTQIMLQWFIAEQVEEEDQTSRAVDQLEMAGESGAALLMLDARFGSRAAEG